MRKAKFRLLFKENYFKQEDDEEVEIREVKINPYKTLIGQLLGWLNLQLGEV